jgi:hypothetical protein
METYTDDISNYQILINEDVDITTRHTHRSFIRRQIFEIIIFISGGIQEMRCVRSSSCQLTDHRQEYSLKQMITT